VLQPFARDLPTASIITDESDTPAKEDRSSGAIKLDYPIWPRIIDTARALTAEQSAPDESAANGVYSCALHGATSRTQNAGTSAGV
jgi:hypothetical protein